MNPTYVVCTQLTTVKVVLIMNYKAYGNSYVECAQLTNQTGLRSQVHNH